MGLGLNTCFRETEGEAGNTPAIAVCPPTTYKLFSSSAEPWPNLYSQEMQTGPVKQGHKQKLMQLLVHTDVPTHSTSISSAKFDAFNNVFLLKFLKAFSKL